MDLNVAAAWAQGVTGRNITTAIMDDGKWTLCQRRQFCSGKLSVMFPLFSGRQLLTVLNIERDVLVNRELERGKEMYATSWLFCLSIYRPTYTSALFQPLVSLERDKILLRSQVIVLCSVPLFQVIFPFSSPYRCGLHAPRSHQQLRKFAKKVDRVPVFPIWQADFLRCQQ